MFCFKEPGSRDTCKISRDLTPKTCFLIPQPAQMNIFSFMQSQTKAQNNSEAIHDNSLSGNCLFYLQHNESCMHFRSHKEKKIQMYINRQTLDLAAFVSWLCILCSATVYISTNIIPVLLQYYRLCLFGDVIIWTVWVNHKFKHSETVIKSILYRNSWLPALLPSPSPSLLQFMFGLDFFFLNK